MPCDAVRIGGAGLRRPADVAMMQATNFWNLHDPAHLGELDMPYVRRILVEREMRASPVIGSGRRSFVHGQLLPQGKVLDSELAVAAEEEREESKQVEQEGDHRAEILSGSAPTDQRLAAGRGFGEGHRLAVLGITEFGEGQRPWRGATRPDRDVLY